MIKLAKTVFAHPLISGSGIIVIGSMIGNFLNFIFNLFMSRNLPISDYGTLMSIISLITLATIPLSSITPLVVSFAGVYFAKNDTSIISIFYKKTFFYLLLMNFVLLLSILYFAGDISTFFKIEDKGLVIFAGIIIAVTYLGTLNGGLLQAKLSFKFISFSNFLSALTKLSFGLIMVLLGFGLFGALGAFLLSFLIPFLISFIPLRFIFKDSSRSKFKLPLKEFVTYGLPSAVAILGLNSLISTDLLIVKHLFNPFDAGSYAGMALVGKVIFYLTAPIGTVMYPLIIQKHAKNEKYQNTLYLATLLVLIPSLAASIFYFLYPEIAIRFFLKNSEYLSISKYLGLFGLFIALYSVISLLTYYFLSIKKTAVWLPLLIASLSQATLIYFLHDSFQQIIVNSLIVSVLLLSSLLIYFRKSK